MLTYSVGAAGGIRADSFVAPAETQSGIGPASVDFFPATGIAGSDVATSLNLVEYGTPLPAAQVTLYNAAAARVGLYSFTNVTAQAVSISGDTSAVSVTLSFGATALAWTFGNESGQVGTSCSTGAGCASGACLGGFCCNVPCASSDDSCAAATCDKGGKCVYPDNSVACGTSTCTGSTLHLTSACGSAGNCASSSAPCPGQLVCDATTNVSCLDACDADTDCVSGYSCFAPAGQQNSCAHSSAASEAMDLCTQAADSANATPPMGIAGFYACIDTGIAVQMEDPDGYCGSAYGGGPFDGWFYAGSMIGQVWSLGDNPPNVSCAPTTQVGTW